MAIFAPGRVFAGHRIEAVAGRGGMGVVYRALDLELQRTVALKLIAPEFAADEAFRVRFKRESRMAASIRHPNVIATHHAGEAEGLLYITMDYIDGVDMLHVIAPGQLEPHRAARLVAQVASALDAAHARGLVHRDVKPGNVLIAGSGDGEHAYLTDFGLTKLASSDSGITQSGTFVGTLDYIAPEQLAGERVDGRADIYALGCVLFHALAGRVPYPRDTGLAKMYAHGNAPSPSIAELVPGIGPELDAVVHRAMAKDPAERYLSAGDLGRAALAAADGHAPSQPERAVATGAAASSAPTVIDSPPTVIDSPATLIDPPATVLERGRAGGLPRRGRAIAAGAITLLATAAVLALTGALGGDGDGDRKPAASAASATKAAPAAARSGLIKRDPANARHRIVIGSKNFTEQFVLGEIYAQALQAAGYTVRKKLGLTNERVAFDALTGGSIDAYPEYTGTVLSAFYRFPPEALPHHARASFEAARRRLRTDGITPLPPAPVNDTYTLAMTRGRARAIGSPHTISDLAAKASRLTATGVPECEFDASCLKSVEQAYHLKFKGFRPAESPYGALDRGRADVAFVFTTDAELAGTDYAALRDDRRLFPPFQVMFMVDSDLLDRLGGDARRAIKLVQKRLTSHKMGELNGRVDLEGQAPVDVAADYLSESGLVK